jgi:hypothetical protein
MSLNGMIHIPSSMKVGTGIQAILRFYLSNLRGCNVGITDGRHLQSAPLRWAKGHDVYSKFHGYRSRHSGNIKVITAIILEVAVLV